MYKSHWREHGHVGFVLLVTLYLVVCVSFVNHCLSCCPFSFDHCVDFLFSIYELGLPISIFKLFLLLIYNMNLHLRIVLFICPRQKRDKKHLSLFKMFKERCFLRQWKYSTLQQENIILQYYRRLVWVWHYKLNTLM